MIVSVQIILFSVFTKTYANSGYIPASRPGRIAVKFTASMGVLIGEIVLLPGVAGTVAAFVIWGSREFGMLEPQRMMRITIPSLVFICVGIQLVFGSFFVEILNNKHK